MIDHPIIRIGANLTPRKRPYLLRPLNIEPFRRPNTHLLNPNNMSTIKIYTRAGDKGTTTLFTGKRLPKTHSVFHCLGTIDELTSLIGISKEYCPVSGALKDQLYKIQCKLQDINAHIATPPGEAMEPKKTHTTFDPKKKLATELEEWIDEMDKCLPPLRNFILPVSDAMSWEEPKLDTLVWRFISHASTFVESRSKESRTIYL